MTEYTDVPKANELHAESQRVAQALANLESGGSITNMTVDPPPPVMPEPGAPITPMAMAVNVTIPPPVDPALLAQLTTWLNNRLVEIAAELTTLGVAVPPAGSKAWSTPPTPPPMMPTPMTVPPPTPPMPTQNAPINPNPHTYSGE